MPRWLQAMVGVALCVQTAGLAAERPASVRLVDVTSESTAASQSVFITATGHAAYTSHQPDPLTVLITLRDVAAGDVSSRLRPAPDDPVGTLEVLDSVDDNGNQVAQVRIGLRQATTYEVRSRQETIQVRFARFVPLAAEPVKAASVPPVADRGRPATAILSVETAVESHFVSVTLRGNGVLSPARILEAEHLPPRLVFDFPRLMAEAALVTRVEIDPVKQVRVAANSPELTRVVLDLMRPAVYYIDDQEPNARSLRVVFPRGRAADAATGSGIDSAAGSAGRWGELDAIGSSRSALALESTPAARLAPSAAPFRVEASPALPSLGGVIPVLDLASTPVERLGPWTAPFRVEASPALPSLGGVIPALDLASTPVERLGPWTAPFRVEASPEIPSMAGAVMALVLDPAASPLALPAPPAVPTDESAPEATLVAASRQTEQYLPLRGGGGASGGSAPRTVMQFPGQTAGGQQEFTGDPISMNFQNADLRAVLRVFADDRGLNIVIDPSVQGEVNVALTEVPWDQAFDIILRTNGLDYEVNGTVVRIASVQRFRDEAQARRELQEQATLAGSKQVYTRALNYASAEDVEQLIRSGNLLSEVGDVFTDARTNTLVITELQDRLATLSDLLDTLDRAEPQVEIEARIVQAGHDSARALGVQWGVTGRAAQEIGNSLPFSFPNRGAITGRAGGPDGQGPSGLDSRALPDENAATAVNLGVSAATSALGLTMGSVNGSLNLDLALSALESEGELSIISSPRVTTQNNVEASILQGDQIPYQTVANNTVTVQFKEAALTLLVTPQITNANTVIMAVDLENSFADFGRALGDPPIPSIVTQRARTTIQVADGETTVIGGIYENTQSERNNRTPMLHRIPLLGWLFKSTDRTESADELMIFLTPRIVR
ncbi:MAG TPA: type IV pilus secretin PilQ [Vicinamibacterales bacterium]|jgi:type IV pilus assembly protein PilQ|nr:type IV pilus secretin PilQ [Vicinamibacterales bacterium]